MRLPNQSNILVKQGTLNYMYDNLLDFILYMKVVCKSCSHGIELPLPLPLSYPYEGPMGLLDHCYIVRYFPTFGATILPTLGALPKCLNLTLNYPSIIVIRKLVIFVNSHGAQQAQNLFNVQFGTFGFNYIWPQAYFNYKWCGKRFKVDP